MRAVGRLGQVAACQLVLALRSSFHAIKPVGDRIFDGLVVASLEMQKRMVFQAPPIASIQGITANKVERSGNGLSGPLTQDKQYTLCHALSDQAEKFPRQVRLSPFSWPVSV